MLSSNMTTFETGQKSGYIALKCKLIKTNQTMIK